MADSNHAKKHRHEWTALWTHWGPYGSQDEHIHECFGRCPYLLVGPGRDCDGKLVTHEITRGVGKRRVPALSEV